MLKKNSLGAALVVAGTFGAAGCSEPLSASGTRRPARGSIVFLTTGRRSHLRRGAHDAMENRGARGCA